MRYRIEPSTPSFGETMQNGLAQSGKDAALITGGLLLGGAALGVAAVKSRRVRLKLMGALHFPASFFIAFAVLVMTAICLSPTDADKGAEIFISAMPWIFLASVIISLIWSTLFIRQYVRPKLREVDEAEYTAYTAARATPASPEIIYPPGYRPY